MLMPRMRRGFTLIELLVVVAILAVLIAILLPSLGKARERAKLVVCETRIRGWGQGLLMYSMDFNGRLPLDGGDGTAALPIGKWDDTFLWFNGLIPYVAGGDNSKTYDSLQLAAMNSGGHLPKGGENSMFVCPSAGAPEPGSGDIMTSPSGSPAFPEGYFMTWGYYGTIGGVPRPMLLCYGMNSQLRSFDFSTVNYGQNAPAAGDVSMLTQLKPAAMIPLFAEKRVSPNELPTNHSSFTKALTQSKVTANRFAARHDKGGSIVFADGHVEWVLNAKIDNSRALKANYYNIPGVITWNPNGP